MPDQHGVQHPSPHGHPRQPESGAGWGDRRLGLLELRERSPGRDPRRGQGCDIGPPPPAGAPQRLRTLPRAPAPPAPGPSKAPREEFQPFPLRRAVCGLLAARPQRGREVGAGWRGPVTRRFWQLPGPRSLPGSGFPASRPWSRATKPAFPAARACAAPLGSAPPRAAAASAAASAGTFSPASRGPPAASCVPRCAPSPAAVDPWESLRIRV